MRIPSFLVCCFMSAWGALYLALWLSSPFAGIAAESFGILAVMLCDQIVSAIKDGK